MRRSRLIALILFSALMLCNCDPNAANSPDYSLEENIARADDQLSVLRDAMISDSTLDDCIMSGMTAAPSDGDYVVFISISDTTQRASVFQGIGESVKAAYDKTAALVSAYVVENNYATIWMKAEIVIASEILTPDQLSFEIGRRYDQNHRKGVAFDEDFSTALLEAEMNANDMIDYDTGTLELLEINEYLSNLGMDTIKEVPGEVVIFACRGWFCNQFNEVWQLYEDRNNYGRRIIEEVDDYYVYDIIDETANFFMNIQHENGKFIYGYHADSGEELESYNTIRHAGAVWNLICQYEITRNESLVPVIENGIRWLMKNYVIYRDRTRTTAFLMQYAKNEIQLGGNALMVLALAKYSEVFETDKYLNAARAFGNGILYMVGGKTGFFNHKLTVTDFSVKKEFVIIYYEGESVFALASLYGVDHDEKWLETAADALDWFAENDYWEYGDHWISYACNEVTKYRPEETYFELGLRNVSHRLFAIKNYTTTSPTKTESFMAAFEMYDRIITNGYTIDYLEAFDAEEFIDAAMYRASYILNGYCYPEYVMYFEAPYEVLGGFFMRSDSFRVRIDDVQHYLGGLCLYYKLYDRLTNGIALSP